MGAKEAASCTCASDKSQHMTSYPLENRVDATLLQIAKPQNGKLCALGYFKDFIKNLLRVFLVADHDVFFRLADKSLRFYAG